MRSSSFESLWRLWLNCDDRGRNFYVYLPPKKARAEQFRAQLRLIGSRWQIVGLDLPDDLKEQLARQLIKATEELLPNTENPNQGPIFCNLSCLCEYAPKMRVVRLAEHLIWMTVPLERDDFQNYT